eukprot:Platyproteum_vivax@DN7356_c0_g3_i1.p1
MKLHICVLLSLVGAAVGAGAKKGTTIDSLTAMAAPTSEQKVFCCPNCDKTYSRSADVIRHCKKTHGMANEKSKKQSSVQHACSCSKGFSTKRELTKHANEHDHKLLRDERNWEYKCEDCDMEFASLTTLNTHFRSVTHQKNNAEKHKKAVLWCSKCNSDFKSEGDVVKQHRGDYSGHKFTVKSVGKNSMNFCCDKCKISFNTRWEQSAHMQGTHGSESVIFDKPVSLQRLQEPCEDLGCGEVFSNKVDFLKHQQVQSHGLFNTNYKWQSKAQRSREDHFMELTGESKTNLSIALIDLNAKERQFLLRREIEEKLAELEGLHVPDFKRQDKRVLTTLLNKNVPKYSTPDMRWTIEALGMPEVEKILRGKRQQTAKTSSSSTIYEWAEHNAKMRRIEEDKVALATSTIVTSSNMDPATPPLTPFQQAFGSLRSISSTGFQQEAPQYSTMQQPAGFFDGWPQVTTSTDSNHEPETAQLGMKHPSHISNYGSHGISSAGHQGAPQYMTTQQHAVTSSNMVAATQSTPLSGATAQVWPDPITKPDSRLHDPPEDGMFSFRTT